MIRIEADFLSWICDIPFHLFDPRSIGIEFTNPTDRRIMPRIGSPFPIPSQQKIVVASLQRPRQRSRVCVIIPFVLSFPCCSS